MAASSPQFTNSTSAPTKSDQMHPITNANDTQTASIVVTSVPNAQTITETQFLVTTTTKTSTPTVQSGSSGRLRPAKLLVFLGSLIRCASIAKSELYTQVTYVSTTTVYPNTTITMSPVPPPPTGTCAPDGCFMVDGTVVAAGNRISPSLLLPGVVSRALFGGSNTQSDDHYYYYSSTIPVHTTTVTLHVVNTTTMNTTVTATIRTDNGTVAVPSTDIITTDPYASSYDLANLSTSFTSTQTVTMTLPPNLTVNSPTLSVIPLTTTAATSVNHATLPSAGVLILAVLVTLWL